MLGWAGFLASPPGALSTAAVVAAASGLTVSLCHGGFVLEWFLGLLTLLLAAWLLLPLPFAVDGRDLIRLMRQVAVCLAPLSLLNLSSGALPQLSSAWSGILGTLGYAAAVALVASSWFLPHLARLPRPLECLLHSPRTVWGLVGLWAAIYSTLAILQWLNFAQFSQDMAIHEQAVYNALHGRFLEYSCDLRYDGQIMSRFADHFEPILLLFVPLYRLWQVPVWFLLAQVLVPAPVQFRWRHWPAAGTARVRRGCCSRACT